MLPTIVALIACAPALAQAPAKPADAPKPEPASTWPKLPASAQLKRNEPIDAAKVKLDQKVLDQIVRDGVKHLLASQEGFERSEWPYEGVYRVSGQIPVGYRIGGTSICAIALIKAPEFDKDGPRKQAVERAMKFVCAGIDQPLMSYEEYDAGYDVRGWGYTYGLMFLLEYKATCKPDKAQLATIEKAIKFYLKALHETTIPTAGGWNYARPQGREKVAPPSPFMTAPTLQALFAAKAAGYDVDAKDVDGALAFLQAARGPGPDRTVVYAGKASDRELKGPSNGVPGASGRMCATEVALMLAGKGNVDDVRHAVDAFVEHWGELDKRRMMSGTHLPPYMVAPYYFMYAHHAAAQAVEFLPEAERAGYREKLNRLLLSVRRTDGTFNDRVFARSGSFGTAMAMLAILQPTLSPPAKWEGEKK
jgi:hypothetical protein